VRWAQENIRAPCLGEIVVFKVKQGLVETVRVVLVLWNHSKVGVNLTDSWLCNRQLVRLVKVVGPQSKVFTSFVDPIGLCSVVKLTPFDVGELSTEITIKIVRKDRCTIAVFLCYLLLSNHECRMNKTSSMSGTSNNDCSYARCQVCLH